MCDVVICDVKVGNVLIQTNLFYHRRLKTIFEADKWNAVCVQYLAQVIVWQSTCENLKIPTQIEDLEEALQAHQDLTYLYTNDAQQEAICLPKVVQNKLKKKML